jgi:hypothetical protein
MSNNNNHQNKQTMAVRILALILAGIMLAGAATIVISLLASVGHNDHDDHDGHNHASVEYVQTF